MFVLKFRAVLESPPGVLGRQAPRESKLLPTQRPELRGSSLI